MSAFDDESRRFQNEVETLAAELIRAGSAASYDAMDMARKMVMERRQRAERIRITDIYARGFRAS